jgi:hypothetical protein
MTAHELARKLLEMPDVMVTVAGYEGGVNEIQKVAEPDELCLNYYEEWYYGKHSYRDYQLDEEEGKTFQKIKAIHISA